jgi:MFS family permease
LPLIPIGFGLGLTFGPTTISVQFRVPPKDVGQATGLVQFLGTLGASIGLSLFSTFQSWRFAQIQPVPPPASCTQNPSTCQPVLLAYQQHYLDAVVTSYVDVFTIMLVLCALALIVSLFLQGSLPKGAAIRDGRPPAAE